MSRTSKNLITVSWSLGDSTRSGQNTEEEKCLVFLGLICRININDLCQGDFNILTRRHHISTRYLLNIYYLLYNRIQNSSEFYRTHPCAHTQQTVSINLLFIQFYQFQIYIFLFSDCKLCILVLLVMIPTRAPDHQCPVCCDLIT